MVYHHMIVFIISLQQADHHIVKGCINNKQYTSRDLCQKEIVHIKHSGPGGIVFHSPPPPPPPQALLSGQWWSVMRPKKEV